MPWYFYIIECSDTSLYCGITNHLERRIEEHNSKSGGKYTRSRTPVELKHFEKYRTRSEAMKREHQVRKWDRKKKMALLRGDSDEAAGLNHAT